MVLARKKSAVEIDAVVVFRDPAAVDELNAQLDDAFGVGGWSSAPFKQGVDAVTTAAEGGAAFLVLGVANETAEELDGAVAMIDAAKTGGMRAILLAESLTPAAIHRLMRAGADDFAPLPLPSSALSESVSHLRFGAARTGGGDVRNGMVLPVYAVAGGVGSTTFAVNLAWELAQETAKAGKQVVLLDFNFQYGTVSTYLDLPRREAIYELLSDTSTLDEEGLGQALTSYANRMSVLTAPMDVLPLDIIGPEDVRTMLDLARVKYDYIVVDLPQTLTHWSDLVLTESETFFAFMQSDMRSAQNMLRFLRTVKAEELPIERVAVCLNKAPGFTDLSGKNRAHRLEKSLGVDFAYRLPDGGKQVAAACDQGAPLARAAKGNPLRKEIRKIARDIVKKAADAMSV